MDIGYISFGLEEKNNLYKVIQSIRDHHAIDELGIGRIRDAFSNKMFPGMSVLQNRAKCFGRRGECPWMPPCADFDCKKSGCRLFRNVSNHKTILV